MKFNKLFTSLAIMALVSTVSAPHAFAKKEGNGTSGGGQRVEVVVFKAKDTLIRYLNSLTEESLLAIEAPDHLKQWLVQGNPTNLRIVRSTLKSAEILFVEGPCLEGKHPRGATFDNSIPDQPKIIFSRSQNLNLKDDEAIALLLHEAGHFTGENDHLFLSELGTDLARVISNTRQSSLVLQSGEIVIELPLMGASEWNWLRQYVSSLPKSGDIAVGMIEKSKGRTVYARLSVMISPKVDITKPIELPAVDLGRANCDALVQVLSNYSPDAEFALQLNCEQNGYIPFKGPTSVIKSKLIVLPRQ